ncbi:GIF [Mytilus coruscus]|uniref:GIF n=1 Tax=Mytilus coruscus TaxID=42192 RepID=A0A6J8DUG2_MYTCO|nr:GIF [Mytilus coruscus]
MADPRNIDIVLPPQPGRLYDSTQKKNCPDNYRESPDINFSEKFSEVTCTIFENSFMMSRIRKYHKYGVGSRQLLFKRDEEWSWGTRAEAEAIIALHLYQFLTFSKDNPDVLINVKQMNIDLLSALSKANSPSTVLLLSSLPAIAMKSYLDIGSQECVLKYSTPSTPSFTIGITILNNITPNDYDLTWSAPPIQGQTLFDALLNLQEADSFFNFTSKSTQWGPYITSICNIAASTDQKQYWQIGDSNGDALQYG